MEFLTEVYSWMLKLTVPDLIWYSLFSVIYKIDI